MLERGISGPRLPQPLLKRGYGLVTLGWRPGRELRGSGRIVGTFLDLQKGGAVSGGQQRVDDFLLPVP